MGRQSVLTFSPCLGNRIGPVQMIRIIHLHLVVGTDLLLTSAYSARKDYRIIQVIGVALLVVMTMEAVKLWPKAKK
jgi:hypothetical protein